MDNFVLHLRLEDLLHLCLKVITFMVSITFIVNFCYIYGSYYICGFYYIYGWYKKGEKALYFTFWRKSQVKKVIFRALQFLDPGFYWKVKLPEAIIDSIVSVVQSLNSLFHARYRGWT